MLRQLLLLLLLQNIIYHVRIIYDKIHCVICDDSIPLQYPAS